jgi:hypothetical protein
MAITFKTKAHGDVTMLDANAKEVLDIIGKAFGARGVITAAEAPVAAEKLRAAGAASRAQGAAPEDDEAPGGGRVLLYVRVQPFIELLESAARKNKDILWGV